MDMMMATNNISYKSFKETYPFDKLKKETSRIMMKYPDRIPVVVEKNPYNDIPSIKDNKYLVPMDLSFGQFIHVIRKRIKISEDQALFLFVNNTLPACSQLMSQIYSEHKDPTGYLFMVYSGEATFG